jgi:hypothetical protein
MISRFRILASINHCLMACDESGTLARLREHPKAHPRLRAHESLDVGDARSRKVASAAA